MESVTREFAAEDDYWRDAHCFEAYWQDGFDYEDFAPAYCVGCIGFVQYGGRFEDAEKCLCANWLRIKGDSRLPLDVALRAMRAAWERVARRREREAARRAIGARLLKLRTRLPEFA